MKIEEYPLNEDIQKEDVLLSDGENGTRKTEIGDLAIVIPDFISEDPAVTHRNIYRGKNLGDTFTQEQLAHIHDGSFEDLYVGDYWVMGGTTYRIADINYFKPYIITNNHLVIIAENESWISAWNSTTFTTSGYYGCTLRTSSLTPIKTQIDTDFSLGSIIPHLDRISNGINSSKGSTTYQNSEWTVELMPYSLIVGQDYTMYHSPSPPTGGILDNAITLSSMLQQLSIFKLNNNLIQYSSWYWVADISATEGVPVITKDGKRDGMTPTRTQSWDNLWNILIRPFFCLG